LAALKFPEAVAGCSQDNLVANSLVPQPKQNRRHEDQRRSHRQDMGDDSPSLFHEPYCVPFIAPVKPTKTQSMRDELLAILDPPIVRIVISLPPTGGTFMRGR
jgi:hypothetical protein